jgi:hypothetical protein
MALTNLSLFLRRVLLVDAIISGTTGLVLMLFAESLQGLLGVRFSLLRYSGISLLPFAALLIFLSSRKNLSRPIIWVIIACNALWAIDSILLLLTNWVEPTTLGYTFIIAQALIVATLAEAQYVGLKKSPVTAN